eukprot:SAG22_NODE_761_length_7410_cov_16.687868_4_plen_321_part_00
MLCCGGPRRGQSRPQRTGGAAGDGRGGSLPTTLRAGMAEPTAHEPDSEPEPAEAAPGGGGGSGRQAGQANEPAAEHDEPAAEQGGPAAGLTLADCRAGPMLESCTASSAGSAGSAGSSDRPPAAGAGLAHCQGESESAAAADHHAATHTAADLVADGPRNERQTPVAAAASSSSGDGRPARKRALSDHRDELSVKLREDLAALECERSFAGAECKLLLVRTNHAGVDSPIGSRAAGVRSCGAGRLRGGMDPAAAGGSAEGEGRDPRPEARNPRRTSRSRRPPQSSLPRRTLLIIRPTDLQVRPRRACSPPARARCGTCCT